MTILSLFCFSPTRTRRVELVPGVVSLFTVLVLSAAPSVAAAPGPTPPATTPSPETTLACGLIDIDALGAARLDALTQALALSVELDDRLFGCTLDPEQLRDAAETAARPVVTAWRDLDPTHLFLVRRAHPGPRLVPTGVEPLAGAAGHELVRAVTDETTEALRAGRWQPAADAHDVPHSCRPPRVTPLLAPAGAGTGSPDSAFPDALADGVHHVLVRQTANRPTRRGTVFPSVVADRVAAVDAARWLADVETLAGWNRYSHGATIDLARDWLAAQFLSLGLETSTETFPVGGSGTEVENVFGLRNGRTRPHDLIIVGGHYDSISQSPSSAAPGAEDNASGCAGVLELARVLAPVDLEASVLFVCFAGEEQGLYGSRDHAADLAASGDDDRVVMMLNMDMIGFSGDADLDLLLETEDEWPTLPDLFEDAAAAFTDLRTVVSFFAFGSDHVPYLDRGMPALLTIQNDWSSYPDYHRTTDLPDRIVLAMGQGVLRTNAAVLAVEAGVLDDSFLFADGFESGDTGSWSPPALGE
ncbi:MAG: M28 family metallopeptidase [Acidobacteriota bacterium]